MSHVVISLHSLPQFKMHEHMTQYDELCQLILLIKEIPCEDSGPEEAAVVQRVYQRNINTHICHAIEMVALICLLRIPPPSQVHLNNLKIITLNYIYYCRSSFAANTHLHVYSLYFCQETTYLCTI